MRLKRTLRDVLSEDERGFRCWDNEERQVDVNTIRCCAVRHWEDEGEYKAGVARMKTTSNLKTAC